MYTNEISSILNKIYPSLSSQKQKAADYFLSNGERLSSLTIKQMADEAETSVSTIERLVKDLGFDRFQDFKLSLVRESKRQEFPIYTSIQKEDNLATIKEKILRCNQDAMVSTMRLLNVNLIQAAIDLLDQAKRIDIYGIGGSGPVCLDAAHKFMKIGVRCQALLDSDLQAMSASLLEKGDVVIAISNSGQSKVIVDNVTLAKNSGASVIAITSYGKSKLYKLSDVVLCTCSSKGPLESDLISARIAQLTIIDTLYTGLAYKHYDASFRAVQLSRNATLANK